MTHARSVQIPLNLTPRLPYSPHGFLVHEGVHAIVHTFTQALTTPRFDIFFVHGASRRGKTHLSIKLFDIAAEGGRYPKLYDGAELSKSLVEVSGEAPVVLVDNADKLLMQLLPGDSGPFVSLVERLRTASAKLVLLSATEMNELPCDEHIMSRIAPGAGHHLELPAESELVPLGQLMAKQRGLILTERKVKYLLRRLGRDIREIEDYFDRVNYLSSLFGQQVKMPLLADAI